jgi:hypothetical protein
MNAPDVFFTGLTLLILSWFVYLGLDDWARRRKLTPEARQREDKKSDEDLTLACMRSYLSSALLFLLLLAVISDIVVRSRPVHAQVRLRCM